jgi:hypothetical protein
MRPFKGANQSGSGFARDIVQNCALAKHVELTGRPIRVLHMQNQLNMTKRGGRSRQFGDVLNCLTEALG